MASTPSAARAAADSAVQRRRSTATRVEKQPGRTYVEFAISCTNPSGKEVLRAGTKGVILD